MLAVMMGSISDLDTFSKARAILDEYEIPYQLRVLSAHRTPQQAVEFVEGAEKVQVFIALAGMAAHLAGCVAAHTDKPVIGVPVASGALQGVDALLSTVQMPPGVPVATVGIGSAGAVNAVVLAMEIIAVGSASMLEKLAMFKQKQREKVLAADKSLRD